MKKIILYALSIFILSSCSSDDSDLTEIFEPDFAFEIKGAINKTITGKGIFFNENTIPVKNGKGEDTEITTLLVWAQDADDVITFAVTLEGSQVGPGDYEVGSDIFTFYNAFVNFSGDAGETISYQSESGTISFSSKALFATGTVNVTCPGVGGGGTITIAGTFHAEDVD